MHCVQYSGDLKMSKVNTKVNKNVNFFVNFYMKMFTFVRFL